MKRFISICLLTLLIGAACDSPLGDLNREPDNGTLSSAKAPKITYSREPVQADTVRKAAWQQFKAQNGKNGRCTGIPIPACQRPSI